MLVPWLPEAGHGVHLFVILLLALLIDGAFGDPPAIYRRVPHPVAALGRLIEVLEGRFNRPGEGRLFLRGLLLTGGVVTLSATVGWAVSAAAAYLPFGWVLEAVLASTLIAFRGLHDHVRAVAMGLEQSLEAGRAAVAHIVGRDPQSLDGAGVARAAIESAAENFADGVVAPVFWFVLFGLPGLTAYKAVNTLDSMIGHWAPRFERFGKAAARLDDAANWVPARLAGVVIATAAMVTPGVDSRGAWRAMSEDAWRHRSPNAGWPEAAMAGALDVALAGPRQYGEVVVEDAWMGTGRRQATPEDIRRALGLYRWAGLLLAGLVTLGAVL